MSIKHRALFSSWKIPTLPSRNKSDDLVIRENTIDFIYFKHGLFPCSTDRWLDCGGNIGAFCCTIAPHVEHVFSYEPAVTNYPILVESVLANDLESKITCIKAAIVGNDDKERQFYLTNGPYAANGHSLFRRRGRTPHTTNCEKLSDIIEKYRITHIKMDVEGAEEELIVSLPDKSCAAIKGMVFEYHSGALKDRHSVIYKDLITILRSNFKRVVAREKAGMFPQLVWAFN